MDFNVKGPTLCTHQHMQRLSRYSCEATRGRWRQQQLRDLQGPTPMVFTTCQGVSTT